MSFLSFDHWPLRLKTLVMLVFASAVPVAVAVTVTYVNARDVIRNEAGHCLGTRADKLVSELDCFHHAYMGIASRISHSKLYNELCQKGGGDELVQSGVRTIVDSDSNIVVMLVLAKNGDVILDSEGAAIAHAPAQKSLLINAAERNVPITDIYLARPNVGSVPLISYVATIHAPSTSCVIAVNVRASAFWDAVRTANGRAGEGSYTVVFDENGIRIAHSFRQNQVFQAGRAARAGAHRTAGAGAAVRHGYAQSHRDTGRRRRGV